MSEFEELTKKVLGLEEKVSKLELALMQNGVCPECGEGLSGTESDEGVTFKCDCGLYHFFSHSFLKSLKKKA